MSHELRTPLNAVLGFSRLLKSGPDVTPRQQETLDIIVRSGEHLLNLINNVLDMAKIESGRMVLEESEVDLHQLLHEMQSLMGVGAAEKGLQFRFGACSGSAPVCCRGRGQAAPGAAEPGWQRHQVHRFRRGEAPCQARQPRRDRKSPNTI